MTLYVPDLGAVEGSYEGTYCFKYGSVRNRQT